MSLLTAAKALVERWDSPLWKDLPHTGEYIAALRAAIAEAEKQEPVANAEFCPHCNPCRNGERIGKAEKLNEEYDFVLRGLASYLGAGGYNETSFRLIDPKTADKKIRWGIDNLHPALTVPQGWQPIETAPQDLTNVLLGWWETWPENKWKQKVGPAGNWDVGMPGTRFQDGYATHWMPLPDAPKQENKHEHG